ncbi:MAG: 23S rRNA (guanosine(2251)-2'-O)-methyltransferase RlmB, partial [Chitinivibrionales bacterium]|nr:23S rRNA (guanosine(2251)-2'-O)-methyltransferase RlmB [Chitinivibrionales bacterium]
PESSLTAVFGIHAVETCILERPNQIAKLYFTQEITSGPLFNCMKECRRLRLSYQVVPPAKLDTVARTDKHQGVVALCMAKAYSEAEALMPVLDKRDPLPVLVIPASIEDPRNLGSIIRTCAGFGVDGILLERNGSVTLTGSVAKTAAGMLEYMPVYKPRNLENIVDTCLQKGFGVVGASERATLRLHEVDFCKPVVIVLGGEDRGIPPYLRRKCTQLVGIPLAPPTPSLNVSVAAAIFLYECSRQRNAKNQ